MIETDLTNKSNAYLSKYRIADWRDIPGLLEEIDSELKQFNLELDLGNCADDNYWIRIVKRKGGGKNV